MKDLLRRLGGLAVAALLALAAAPGSGLAQDGAYTLGGGDKLRIIVYGEDDLSGEFEVDSTGLIAMPLIGSVRATGLTARQLEIAISRKLLEGYLKQPQVSAEVLNYRPYFIDGEVEAPGEYPFRQGITVREAAAIAGGFTYWANKKRALITRWNDPTKQKRKVPMETSINPGDYIWIDD